MVNINYVEHKGVNYVNIVSEKNREAVCAMGGSRLVIQGKPNITLMKGSWKFGEQVQFGLFCPKGSIKKECRNESRWDIIEIDMPVEEGKELIRAAYNILFNNGEGVGK